MDRCYSDPLQRHCTQILVRGPTRRSCPEPYEHLLYRSSLVAGARDLPARNGTPGAGRFPIDHRLLRNPESPHLWRNAPPIWNDETNDYPSYNPLALPIDAIMPIWRTLFAVGNVAPKNWVCHVYHAVTVCGFAS